MPRMRITIIVPHWGLSGGVRTRIQLANELSGQFQITLLFLSCKGNRDAWQIDPRVTLIQATPESWANALPEADITIPYGDFSGTPQLYKHTKVGQVVPFFQGFGVVNPHIEEQNARHPGPKLCHSQWLLNILDSYDPSHRHYKLTPGSAQDSFYPLPRTTTRFTLGLFTHRAPYKDFNRGYDEAVKARNILGRDNIDIISFGKARPGLFQRQVTHFGLLKPNSSELRQAYSNMDIFIWPAWQEGFARPPLEAMSCGAAVISSEPLSTLEMIENFKSGLLIHPAMIHHAIIMLYNNPELLAHIKQQGQLAAQRFTWQQMAIDFSTAIHDISRQRN